MASPSFDTAFQPAHGLPVIVAPDVARITAPNSGPMTFKGTNTYLIGRDELALVDPGPDDEAHFAAVMAAINGRRLSHILLTHTHLDHSAMLARLADQTGAVVAGCGPHRPARHVELGEINHLDAAADKTYAPDIEMAHGNTLMIDGIQIEAIQTPGHTANHLSFAIGNDGVVLTGDHIMAWATTIIAPPDGSMRDYLASLELMEARSDRLYLPGHGGPVSNTHAFVRGLKAHRRMRERAILERLKSGDRSIPAIVSAIYRDTDRRLHGAAALSVMAHMEDLVERGLVACDGPLALDASYQPVTPINA